MIKDFSISFSRVTVVQDFETVTFYVLFVYKPTSSVIFCCMKGCSFQVSSIVFSSYTFPQQKPFSLLRGYTEVKINTKSSKL